VLEIPKEEVGVEVGALAKSVFNKKHLLAQIDLFKESRLNWEEKRIERMEKEKARLRLKQKTRKFNKKKGGKDWKGAWTAYKRGYATLSASLPSSALPSLISNTLLARNLSEANYITRLSAIKSKIKNWKKKKTAFSCFIT